jgi:hypothetical protein
MLGLKTRGLVSPEGGCNQMKVYVKVQKHTRKKVNTSNNSSQVSYQWAPDGLFIGEIKGLHYNVCNVINQPLHYNSA